MAADARRKFPPDGTRVRARPAGWNEELTPEQEFDLEPRPADPAEYLTGPVRVVRSNKPPVGPVVVVLVGGREPDPDTVEAL